MEHAEALTRHPNDYTEIVIREAGAGIKKIPEGNTETEEESGSFLLEIVYLVFL